MGERIDTISPAKPGRRASYPWESWMDGCAWRIRRGVDFTILPDNMGRHLRDRARRYSVAVRVTVDNATETVEFRFEPAEQAAA